MDRIGQYEIQGTLGHGAMGIVYQALDPLIGRTVAIKTIKVRSDGDDRSLLRQRLLSEARAAGNLSHPGIVTIYQAGEEGDLTYIVMEFVEGVTLRSFLSTAGKVPPLEVAIRILKQMAAALDYAHVHGVVHRDIKPENIMIARSSARKVTSLPVHPQAP